MKTPESFRFVFIGFKIGTLVRNELNAQKVTLNPLSANPTNGQQSQIVWVCLTILWGWRLKG